MAHISHSSANFTAFEMRGGGMLLRHLNSSTEVFFQPGDDAAAFRDAIDALAEVSDDKRDVIFDMVCSNYV